MYSGARAVLGDSFTRIYLERSLACGAFDLASDVDFVIVTEVNVTGEIFQELQALHEQLALLDPVWSNKLEGSFISRVGLRHFDPAQVMHPMLEWGEGVRLFMAAHDARWDMDCAYDNILIANPRRLVGMEYKNRLKHARVFDLRRLNAQIHGNKYPSEKNDTKRDMLYERVR